MGYLAIAVCSATWKGQRTNEADPGSAACTRAGTPEEVILRWRKTVLLKFMSNFRSAKWSHYPAAYTEEFSCVPNVRSVLEIGVAGGGSLYYWRDMFPTAQIYGIDIDSRCKEAEGENIRVFIGSQADRKFLRALAQQIEPPDIIVDDGCHRTLWQKRSFEELWPILRSPGCYCVEDLHTAYMPFWRSGNWAGSFLRFAGVRLLGELNGYWHKPGPLTGQIVAVNFRDSMVFIHKGIHPKPTPLLTSEVDLQH